MHPRKKVSGGIKRPCWAVVNIHTVIGVCKENIATSECVYVFLAL
jgi:hypothetical protein